MLWGVICPPVCRAFVGRSARGTAKHAFLLYHGKGGVLPGYLLAFISVTEPYLTSKGARTKKGRGQLRSNAACTRPEVSIRVVCSLTKSLVPLSASGDEGRQKTLRTDHLGKTHARCNFVSLLQPMPIPQAPPGVEPDVRTALQDPTLSNGSICTAKHFFPPWNQYSIFRINLAQSVCSRRGFSGRLHGPSSVRRLLVKRRDSIFWPFAGRRQTGSSPAIRLMV